MASPKYDIVLFGATSFVGKILAHYFTAEFGASGTGGKLKWAAAGRSRSKLKALKEELGQEAADLDLLNADASDEAALRKICMSARVMVSTVGPYALYGASLVKVCAETGTDYCDITGEVHWVRRMIQAYESKAQASGARIVHCCGFDSVPSDMGVFFLQTQAKAKFGDYCQKIKMRVRRMRGEFSGGTVASLMNVVKEASEDSELRKELADPYSVCPSDHHFFARQPNVKKPQHDPDFNCWVAPFVMAGINTRIVHRSNALSGSAYGKEFLYDEAMIMGAGLGGVAKAYRFSGAMGGFMLAAALPPSRWVLERYIVPKPGEGPSEDAQNKGYYDIRFFGETENGQTIWVKVFGDKDPGYGSTAKMLGQAAICLAQDITKEDKGGGFWTPATLMGQDFLNRLQAHSGLTFEVLAEPDDGGG